MLDYPIRSQALVSFLLEYCYPLTSVTSLMGEQSSFAATLGITLRLNADAPATIEEKLNCFCEARTTGVTRSKEFKKISLPFSEQKKNNNNGNKRETKSFSNNRFKTFATHAHIRLH